MAEQERDEQSSGGGSQGAGQSGGTGDPGRTPGKAEGSERTVEEDLNRQGGASS